MIIAIEPDSLKTGTKHARCSSDQARLHQERSLEGGVHSAKCTVCCILKKASTELPPCPDSPFHTNATVSPLRGVEVFHPAHT